MKKNIVLKMLTGVITTGLTVAGITVSATTGSQQDTADVFVVDDEEQEAETAYAEGPKYSCERLQTSIVAEDKMSDEHASDTAEDKGPDGQTPVDAVETTGHAATKEQAATDEKIGSAASTASTGKTASSDTTANTGKTGSDKTAISPDIATTTATGKASNTDTTANADKTSSDKTAMVSDTATTAATDTAVAAQTETTAIQTEVPVKAETTVKTETAAETAATDIPEEEENHVVTSNIAYAEVTITFPVAKEPEEEQVEEEPVYIEIHDCNCGWNTTDYSELKMHMYNHAIKGEAYSYCTVVKKQ